jgi:hypothetical protein
VAKRADFPPLFLYNKGMLNDQTTKMAISATLHCLTGCAIGEVSGMVIGTAVGMDNMAMFALSILLAFLFGYTLTSWPLLRSGMTFRQVAPLALAADTLSIAVMEILDNTVVAIIPGALDATLASWLFWASMAASLVIAFIAAVPVNRWLISRGKGHAVMHDHHH